MQKHLSLQHSTSDANTQIAPHQKQTSNAGSLSQAAVPCWANTHWQIGVLGALVSTKHTALSVQHTAAMQHFPVPRGLFLINAFFAELCLASSKGKGTGHLCWVKNQCHHSPALRRAMAYGEQSPNKETHTLYYYWALHRDWRWPTLIEWHRRCPENCTLDGLWNDMRSAWADKHHISALSISTTTAVRLHPESVGLQAMDPGSRPVLLITSLLPLTKAGQSVGYNIKLTVPRVLNSKGYRLVKVEENKTTLLLHQLQALGQSLPCSANTEVQGIFCFIIFFGQNFIIQLKTEGGKKLLQWLSCISKPRGNFSKAIPAQCWHLLLKDAGTVRVQTCSSTAVLSHTPAVRFGHFL